MHGRRRFLFQISALSLLLGGCRPQEQVSLQVGDDIVGQTFSTLDGETFRLDASSGPCLINFWATWCVPCRAEMAGLERLSQKMERRGLKVFGISIDTDLNLVREFLLLERLSFPMLLDAGGLIARQAFGVTAYPCSFLIDARGRVTEKWMGGQDWDAPGLQESVVRIL